MYIKLIDGEELRFEKNIDYFDYVVNYGLLILKKGDRWTAAINVNNIKYFITV